MKNDPHHSAEAWIQPDDSVVRLMKLDAERHPGWADKVNLWGLVLLTKGRAGEAAETFGRCLEMNPRYSWASLNRVHAMALAGDLPGARRALSAIEHAPPAARVLAAAFTDLLEGHIEGVAERLGAQAEEISGRHDVRRLRAALLRVQGKDEAEAVWKQLEADLPAVDRALAAPWDRSGSVTTRYLSFVPGLHVLWYETSTLLGHAGHVEASEQSAAVAFLLWADRGLYTYQRGLLASFRGEKEVALNLYLEASRLTPTNPRPHAALAFHWSAQGDLERALESCAGALERAPYYADLHYQMGLLLRARGMDDDALSSFRRALEINPRYTMARLSEAGTLFALEQWQAARDAYDQVLEAGLVSSDIHMHVGQIEDRLANPERAAAAYLDAIRLNPREAEAHYLIGALHLRRGDREAARKAWKTFLKLSRDPKRVVEVEGLLKSA
jgi:tetratricopeptide (TPR) repeat protein